ncbi:MAG: hypothetical protein SNI83_07070 [Rikenellaceae bacterium]
MKLKNDKTLRRAEVVLIDESELVGIYSILKDGEEYSEFENFLLAHMDSHKEEVGTLIARINRLKETGCFERHFRREGKMRDRVFALPNYLDHLKLRLYCIVISENIIVFGNGGEKNTATYNEDPCLNACVKTLQKIDGKIIKRQDNNDIIIEGKELKGDLSFQYME